MRMRHLYCAAALVSAPPVEVFAQPIEPAPAFTADQLVAQPTDAWITNGGNVFNQRYSPLTGLDRGNVAGLKGLWRTSMGSGASFKDSGQAFDADDGSLVWTLRTRKQGE